MHVWCVSSWKCKEVTQYCYLLITQEPPNQRKNWVLEKEKKKGVRLKCQHGHYTKGHKVMMHCPFLAQSGLMICLLIKGGKSMATTSLKFCDWMWAIWGIKKIWTNLHAKNEQIYMQHKQGRHKKNDFKIFLKVNQYSQLVN